MKHKISMNSSSKASIISSTLDDQLEQAVGSRQPSLSTLSKKKNYADEASVDTTAVDRYSYVTNTRYAIKAKAMDVHRQEREWSGNGQGATNADEYHPTITFNEDYPVEYSCQGIINASWELSRHEIWFDYEVAIDRKSDLYENIKAIRWSILDKVVQTIGLDLCEVEKQKRLIDRVRRNLSEPQEESTQQLRRLTGDAGDYDRRDAVSLEYPTTIYQVSSSRTDEIGEPDGCKWLTYDPQAAVCFPIRGKLIAQFRGDEFRNVEEYIRRIVHNSMKSKKVLVNQVTNVEYVGNRFTATQPAVIVQPTGQLDQSSIDINNVLGVTVAVGSFVFVLLVGLFFCRTRKTIAMEKHEDDDDLELGGDSRTEATAAQQSEEVLPEKEYLQFVVPVPTLTLSTSTEDSANSQDGDHQQEENQDDDGKSVKSTSSFGGRAEDSAASSALPAALPPRPPARKSSTVRSVKLRKRRKKKKKKKTQALKRINSRENMKEMEPIKESEDEESEFGSEFGSECDSEFETDDEGSSNASSSCHTPLSRSNFPSRSSSPQLSPRDELFPSDVFDNFDFIIEAADFPFPTLEATEDSRTCEQQQESPPVPPSMGRNSPAQK